MEQTVFLKKICQERSFNTCDANGNVYNVPVIGMILSCGMSSFYAEAMGNAYAQLKNLSSQGMLKTGMPYTASFSISAHEYTKDGKELCSNNIRLNTLAPWQ